MNELLQALSLTALALTQMQYSRNVFDFVRFGKQITKEQLGSKELIALYRAYNS